MVFAGVDAGAKIFVELNGDSGVAAAATVKQNNNDRILVALRIAQLCPCRMFHTRRAPSASVCLAALTLANVTVVSDWEVTPMCYAVCFCGRGTPEASMSEPNPNWRHYFGSIASMLRKPPD